VFTQCSKCETIFKLSAEVLRTAGGQVRCGRCGEVFNALARLAEDPGAFNSGESQFELESRADRILESPAAPPAPPDHSAAAHEEVSPGGEIAHLRIEGWDADALADAVSSAGVEGASSAGVEGASIAGAELASIAGAELAAIGGAELAAIAAEDVSNAAAEGIGIGLNVSEDARRELLAALPQQAAALPEFAAARATREDLEFLTRGGPKPRWRGAWIVAAVLLALILGAQVIHQNRAALAATALGPALRALYAKLGEDLSPAPSPAAYQVRQWGVTGDPGASGVLHVRASLLNATALLQPYPLLRVSLTDRFGARIGTRDFQAAEYLSQPPTLLRPGERVEASIDILDPGKTAEGFDIDVCVRGPAQTLRCQGDAEGKPR